MRLHSWIENSPQRSYIGQKNLTFTCQFSFLSIDTVECSIKVALSINKSAKVGQTPNLQQQPHLKNIALKKTCQNLWTKNCSKVFTNFVNEKKIFYVHPPPFSTEIAIFDFEKIAQPNWFKNKEIQIFQRKTTNENCSFMFFHGSR